MINSPILDVAIVLSFTYFMLSLILTALNEAVLTKLSKRGELLKEALESLFFDNKEINKELKEEGLPAGKKPNPAKVSWKEFATKNLIESPHIQSLKRNAGSFPSYIPAVNFVSGFIDCIRSAVVNPTENGKVKLLDMSAIKEVLTNKESAIPDAFRITLLSMFERSQGDFQKFQAEIEGFYNNAMDRVSGWYKRIAGRYIFWMAFVVVSCMNVDSIFIVKQLWSNPKLEGMTDKIVAQIDSDALKDTVLLHNYAKTRELLMASEIPMGWSIDNTNAEGRSDVYKIYKGSFVQVKAGLFIDILLKIIGWMITAFALTLGAPFWFDLLNKFVNIRGSGKKPEDSKPAGDKYLSQPATPIAVPTAGGG